MPREAGAVDLDPVEKASRCLPDYINPQHGNIGKCAADVLRIFNHIGLEVQFDNALADVGCDRQIDGLVSLLVDQLPRNASPRDVGIKRSAERGCHTMVLSFLPSVDESM